VIHCESGPLILVRDREGNTLVIIEAPSRCFSWGSWSMNNRRVASLPRETVAELALIEETQTKPEGTTP
jgi:hypothetical protein